MNLFFRMFVLLVLMNVSIQAQVLPADSDTLNHTQILFEYTQVAEATYYRIQVTEASDRSTIVNNLMLSQTDSSTATIISGFDFGKKYSWIVTAYNSSGKAVNISSIHHFSIGKNWCVDETKRRVRINKNISSANSGGLVFFDLSRIVVNRQGNPVWYLPNIPNEVDSGDRIRDIRMTNQGTITFMNDRSVYEIDLGGKIIWKGPNDGKVSGDTAEFYHHSFQKLLNGNYMTLGRKYSYKLLKNVSPSASFDGDTMIKIENNLVYKKTEYGNIIEYDKQGKVVWTWSSENYLKDDDILFQKMKNGIPEASSHMNAFDIDEKKNLVTVGFRDLNRIIIIDKQSGKVINSIGKRMPSGEAKSGNGLFRFQHDANILSDGRIALFNNDSVRDSSVVSSAMIIKLNGGSANEASVDWEIKCNLDSLTNGKSLRGGNILDFPNGNFLISFGALNRAVEVTRDKQIVWDAFTEVFNIANNNWFPFQQYRVSYVSSLYPYYFTIEKIGKSIQFNPEIKTYELKFKIVNEGTNDDRYSGKILNADSKVIAEIKPTGILTGNYKIITLKIDSGIVNDSKELIIKIHSDAGQQRTLKVVVF